MAAGFPTTVNPIIQNRCVPVFFDITLPTYQTDAWLLEQPFRRTRAIMIAHTLGNPFDLGRVTNFVKQHVSGWLRIVATLWARPSGQTVGTFGDLATVSFYPPTTSPWAKAVRSHQLAAAENSRRIFPRLGARLLVRPGKENTCGSVSSGNWASSPADTITSTLIPISATT